MKTAAFQNSMAAEAATPGPIEFRRFPCEWSGIFDAPPLGSVVCFAGNAAAFSDDESRMCRYAWASCWNPNLPLWMWVMLNPSKATENRDDPTANRCLSFTKRPAKQEAGGLVIVNLFARRATDRKKIDLNSDRDVGADNDKWIQLILKSERVSKIIAAWGNDGHFTGRRRDVLRLLRESGIGIFQLGKSTRHGAPRHPLYLHGDTPIVPYGKNGG